jgi:hypothetical protein
VTITIVGDDGIVTYGTVDGRMLFEIATGLVQCAGMVIDVGATTTTVVTGGRTGTKNVFGYVDGRTENVTITTDGDEGIVTI